MGRQVTTNRNLAGLPLVQPFPRPGPSLTLAYRELDVAENGTDEQKKSLGSIHELPRPWAPATCTKPQLRVELWNWLDAVVVWINHELVFDPVDIVPSCWPQHAHLVHELAVLADLRRRAERALTSDLIEDWHRYALPAFLERMRHRVAAHCDENHPKVWPAAGRFNRHLDDSRAKPRQDAFAQDLKSIAENMSSPIVDTADAHLRLVNEATGELLD